MLHSIKKKVSKHTATASSGAAEPSAEFKDFKLRLETIKKNLLVADKRMDETKKHWLKHVMDQRAFSSDFRDGVADTSSDTFAVAADFADGADVRYNHFVRETNPVDAPYNKMHMQLKAYLKEITEVEGMYKKLIEAKSEASRYQGKVDGIEKSKKEDEIRKERNLQKLDAERENYMVMQREVIDAQKKVYGKSGIAQNMALVAYWQMNAEHVKVMQASLEKTNDYAAENYEDLADLDISRLELGDQTTLPSACTETPPRPSSIASSTVGSEKVPVAL